ncbi:MAG: M48 family metallopeptidase [Rickettsiales bacterium]|jgi:predicted metal-dependent hydrolase|nr:M48 family metallopeptidase [Rickettsiales bacterium]
MFFSLLNGEKLPVEIITRRNSRSIIIHPKFTPARKISVSRPVGAREADIIKFLEFKRKWLSAKFSEVEPLKIKQGDVVILLGKKYLVEQPTRARFERYVKLKFMEFAKEQICKMGGKCNGTISLKDTTSRWGSCASNGRIAFSWRLAFAPPEVARYVIAHEFAHLKHFDHSPQFWLEVGRLYGRGWQRARDWLTDNGQSLYGV